jgi:hypothetical protein
MSYTDYLNRKKINTPQIIDTQMRLPDASSFTWRAKLAATSVLPASTHVINNSQDTPAPRLFSPKVMSYPGNGLGGKVQDASTFTLSRGARALGNDNFRLGRIQTVTKNSAGNCLTTTPASQVVNINGNAEGSNAGLNMGYRDHKVNGAVVSNTVGVCTQQFLPLTESQFVDTIPDLKTRQIGTTLVQSTDGAHILGTQRVQNPVLCSTTTTGNVKGTSKDSNGINLPIPKSEQPLNLHPPGPFNPERAKFITGIQGPQVGGANLPGGRADKVGGPVPRVTRVISHRGWGGRTRNPYPSQYIPPNNAPAHLKINDATHYKNGSS